MSVITEAKGINTIKKLPDSDYNELWDAIIVDQAIKDQVLG